MLKKGSMTVHDYFLKMRTIADTLTFTGQSISDDELLLYILGGLGSEYDPVVVNLTSRLKVSILKILMRYFLK